LEKGITPEATHAVVRRLRSDHIRLMAHSLLHAVAEDAVCRQSRSGISASINQNKLTDMDKPLVSQAFFQSEQLVQEYRQVLQCLSSLLTLGAPETLLPAPSDEIRQALRAVAHATATDGLTGPTELDNLRTAYQSLASFLPYEEANAAALLQAAFDRGDRTYISSRTAVQTVARAQRIEQEAGALAREFDAFLEHNESDDLLSEIDALLAELGRKFVPTANG